MSTTHNDRIQPISLPRLPEGRVDRALVHRRHAEETFLADVTQTGPDAFTATAVLPPAHRHYGRHTGPSAHLDPLLLLECARQAETCAAHLLFGVEPDAHFVLRDWSAQFALHPPGDRGRPAELLLTAQTRNARTIGGRLRGLEYRFGLWVAGSRVGRVRMDVGYVGAAAYTALRGRRRRGGAPPSSDSFVPLAGRPVDPAAVGRIRPTDVVLLGISSGAEPGTARLRVPTENPSMFDHAQDHVPAMVLMEAARQLAVLAVAGSAGAGPDRTKLVALQAAFGAYAELDEPVDLTATAPAASTDRWSVDVHFHQGDLDIAHAQAVVAGPGPTPGRATR